MLVTNLLMLVLLSELSHRSIQDFYLLSYLLLFGTVYLHRLLYYSNIRQLS